MTRIEGKPSAVSILEAERFVGSPQAGMAGMASMATSGPGATSAGTANH